jgi:hypothetical protein
VVAEWWLNLKSLRIPNSFFIGHPKKQDFGDDSNSVTTTRKRGVIQPDNRAGGDLIFGHHPVTTKFYF